MRKKTITRSAHVQLLTDKLKELIDKAPDNWAIQVSNEMGISVSSVRKIVDGSRRVKDNILRLQIARHITNIIAKEKKETNKMIETIETL